MWDGRLLLHTGNIIGSTSTGAWSWLCFLFLLSTGRDSNSSINDNCCLSCQPAKQYETATTTCVRMYCALLVDYWYITTFMGPFLHYCYMLVVPIHTKQTIQNSSSKIWQLVYKRIWCALLLHMSIKRWCNPLPMQYYLPSIPFHQTINIKQQQQQQQQQQLLLCDNLFCHPCGKNFACKGMAVLQ